MNTSAVPKPGLIAAALAISAMIAIGVPLALAAPTAVPPSDSQGYLDSTARCAKPDTAVVFGTTETSRVAICQTAGGEFEYRGVRVRDGARLIVPASRISDEVFVAKNDGVTYTVTAEALSVSANGDTFRTQSWTDFNSPQAPASTTSGSTSAKPSTAGPATTSGPTASKTTAAPSTSNVPLPPPLPAEAGGSTS
ncbi:hypothetical protein MCEMAEM6B_01750 [Mycobacteriaceae bacterium]